MDIYDELSDLQAEVDYRMECLLQHAGWHHTSRNPLFTWLWEKEIDGTHYMVSTQTAYALQRAADEPVSPGAGLTIVRCAEKTVRLNCSCCEPVEFQCDRPAGHRDGLHRDRSADYGKLTVWWMTNLPARQ